MSMADTDYLRVWQQGQQWPPEQRRSLAHQISQSLQRDQAAPHGAWTEVGNARRCHLIDKEIQEILTETERQELECLTEQMRAYRRRVAPIPMDGARQLHQHVLAKRRRPTESPREEA